MPHEIILLRHMFLPSLSWVARGEFFSHLNRLRIKDIIGKPVSQEGYVFMIPYAICKIMMIFNECIVGSSGENKPRFGFGFY